MRARLETMKRLVKLYGLVEEIHSAELQLKTSALREVTHAVSVQQQVARSADIEGRRAWMSGDRIDREIAASQREPAAWRYGRLREIEAERERMKDVALTSYTASRLRSEQISRLAEGIAARAEIVEARRAQAVSDDRFLARSRWIAARNEELMKEP